MSLMQECPRCGFTQPEDRFCANCGLDIENYNPTPKTLIQKLFDNDLFKISAMLFIGIIFIVVLYQQKKDRLSEFDSLTEENQIPSSTPAESSNYNPQAEPQALAQASTQKEIAKKTFIKTEESDTREEAATASIPTAPVKAPMKADLTQAQLTLSVESYEIKTSKLKPIVEEGQIISEGSLVQFIVPPGKTNPSTLGDQKLASFSTTFPDEKPYFWEFMKPIEGSQEPMGITYRFAITEKDSQAVTLEIMGYYNIFDSETGQMFNQEFQSSIKIRDGIPVISIGFLPRQGVSNDNLQILKDTPLEILGSQSFLEGNSDYLLIIKLSAAQP